MGRFTAALAVASLVVLACALHVADAKAPCPCAPGTKRCCKDGPCVKCCKDCDCGPGKKCVKGECQPSCGCPPGLKRCCKDGPLLTLVLWFIRGNNGGLRTPGGGNKAYCTERALQQWLNDLTDLAGRFPL
ncbi:hypothetical protein CBR_g37056 [Chara braunii]|uniref:Uncharacterized protein n=1 Tax=Chara braunii TaxID=69332 RepID=A0A388LMA2_CHABU|nr:hypothetical protein CBR_g37056 [Chara braunii]|eukprot:GBG83342.1 hypothetical protein CBR_g37056 [Chara braunii]